MTRPIDRAQKAHLATRVPPELDVRILGRFREPLRHTPRMPLWWIPAFTTPAVLLLWFFLHSPSTPMSTFTATGLQGELQQPVAPEPWFPSPALLPEPPGNMVTLWCPGETGVQTLLDPTVSYGACNGVHVLLHSPWATLEKRSEEHFVVLSGKTEWHVRYIETSLLMLEAGGMVLEVGQSRFSLEVTPKKIQLEVLEGRITAYGDSAEPRQLSAGQTLNRRLAVPEPRRLSEQEIRSRLKSCSEGGRHGEAADFIRQILPSVRAELRESLLLDLASIYGAHFHDWDRACETLDWLMREFPDGRLKNGALHLRSRYRCN